MPPQEVQNQSTKTKMCPECVFDVSIKGTGMQGTVHNPSRGRPGG